MIYYLTAARAAGAMSLFLDTYGRSLAERIRILTYEQIFSGVPIRLPRGAYVFAAVRQPFGSYDPPSQARQMAANLHNHLVQACGAHRVLNNPLLSQRRLIMLRNLHQHGMNQFNAYRAADVPESVRYPVFLREDYGTRYGETPLLWNRSELDAALARVQVHEWLLAVEYCDTADAQGIYRKFGAFIVGDRIVPRHLFFSRGWMVKSAELAEPASLAEELAYLESNPHADELLEVCRMANITYGRIDYALLNGKVQVWEINTAPTIMTPSNLQDVSRRRVHERFTQLFSAALDALDTDTA